MHCHADQHSWGPQSAIDQFLSEFKFWIGLNNLWLYSTTWFEIWFVFWKGFTKYLITKSLDTQFLFQNRSIYGFEMKSTFDSGNVCNECKVYIIAITRKISGFLILFLPPENKYFRHFINQNRETNLHKIKKISKTFYFLQASSFEYFPKIATHIYLLNHFCQRERLRNDKLSLCQTQELFRKA